jgi:hypothetical protein
MAAFRTLSGASGHHWGIGRTIRKSSAISYETVAGGSAFL